MFFPSILISCGYGIQLTRWLSLHTNAGSPMEETEKSQRGMVTIYSVMGCPHCRQAKSRLLELGLPLREVDTNQHAELWLRVKQLTGRSTVPQIFFNSVHVGGNDDLQTMAPEKLEHLVHLVREEPMPPDAPPLPVEAHLEGGGNQDGENKCERDDFADMVAEFKECGVIGNHRKGLKVYKNSFTGVQLLDWLEREKGLDRSEALETSKTLMDRKFFNSVPRKREFEEGNALFRLVEHGPHSALNAGQMAACVPLQAAELSEILRNMMLRLYSDHLSADGKTVDYKAMSQSPSFERYCELAVQLQRLDLQALSRAEKLAFFINIYNALVIHGNLRLGAPKNPWQRYRVRARPAAKIFSTGQQQLLKLRSLLIHVPYATPLTFMLLSAVILYSPLFSLIANILNSCPLKSMVYSVLKCYLIGGEVFTLQQEHGYSGIKRCREPSKPLKTTPGLQFFPSLLFSRKQVRLGFLHSGWRWRGVGHLALSMNFHQVALPQAEPLIHFALNCGAKGCPPIKTYTPKDIDSQLHIAAEAFLEEDDACRVDADKGEVKLSQVFKWYRGDFGDTDEKVLNWIVNHMSDSPKKSCLQALLKAGKFRVSYMPYDWSPNSKD
ncbi:uncharacterized protein zgc:152951 [Anguilla rostrata]|uniref:uncharacterized protein zgc:152951 n=1 Tax=Anguilla rostrata TaxID=7938 RepID=UPI0030D1E17B